MIKASGYPIAVLSALLVLLIPLSSALGASIVYGDVDDIGGGGEVQYLNVTESSDTTPLPLYGAPAVSVNTLSFDASALGVSTNAGQSASIDGVASFGISPVAGYYVTDVTLSESGDYSMIGGGTSSTFFQLSAPVTVTISEVDGAPITPVVVTTNLTMAPNPSGRYESTGQIVINDSWQGDLVVDVVLALDAAGVSWTYGATEVDVSLDNSMAIETEATTSVLVRTSDVSAIATVQLPEPSTVALALLGLSGLLLARRRR